jgi:hypothetical protein
MTTPLIPFTLAWLIGLWLASHIALPILAFGVATVVAIVGIILAWRAPKPRWIFALVLAAILGAFRYNLAQPHFDQTSLATYNDQQKSAIVEGVVVAEPDARDAYMNLRVESDRLIITDQPTKTVKGLVLIVCGVCVQGARHAHARHCADALRARAASHAAHRHVAWR